MARKKNSIVFKVIPRISRWASVQNTYRYDKTITFYKNGKKHNENGPAVIDNSIYCKRYYLCGGKELNKNHYESLLKWKQTL